MAKDGFSLAALLVHSNAIPRETRQALMAASVAPPEQRDAELESAAHFLYRDTELDCRDARELLGLSSNGSCG